MKRNILAIITLTTLSLSALAQTPVPLNTDTTPAVTNTTPTSTNWFVKFEQLVASSAPTNFLLAPYGTYVTGPKKFGYGLLGTWNLNQNLGVAAAIDHVDTFVGFNGGLELKLPTHPLAWAGLTNFTATPFVLSMVGTPLSGAGTENGAIQTANSLGANIDIVSLGKGYELSGGGAYGTRSGAGTYSGKYINLFLAVRKGF